MEWTVYKFGGSSLADSECFDIVSSIIKDSDSKRLAVVVSAISGTTDALLAITDLAAKNKKIDKPIRAIASQYESIVLKLLSKKNAKGLLSLFNDDLESIRKILKASSIVNSSTLRVQEIVSGFGELWSSRLLTKVLQERISDNK